jgi:hypothetical protein
MDSSQDKAVLTAAELGTLLDALRQEGYRVLGPTVRDRAIVYDDIAAPADLPRGWTDAQEAGHYRLERRGDDALFGFAVGPHSWKKFLHAPVLNLWKAKREDDSIQVAAPPEEPEPMAFVGVRACELAAIAIQDKVFLGGPYVDPHYRARREKAFAAREGVHRCGKLQQGWCDLLLRLDEHRAESRFWFRHRSHRDHGRVGPPLYRGTGD